MNSPSLKLKLITSFIFLLISSYAFGVQENVYQSKNDSIINQIVSLRDEATKQLNPGNAINSLEKLELSLKLFKDYNIQDNTLLFGLYVDLSNIYGVESIRNEKKSIEYVSFIQRNFPFRGS